MLQCEWHENSSSIKVAELKIVPTGKRNLNAEKIRTSLLQYAISPDQSPLCLKTVIQL